MNVDRLEDKHIPIDAVKTNGRFRKDLGDISGMAESIADKGLLNPVTVAPDYTLICGARRLAALRELGWPSVPVRIMDNPTEALRLEAERDENTCRLEMKPSEKAALGAALEPIERAKSQERKRAASARGGSNGERDRKIRSPAEKQEAKTDHRVAKALGWSESTYDRARQVLSQANSGDPVAQAALAEMDRTGNVTAAFRKATHRPDPPKKPPAAPTTDKGRRDAKGVCDRVSKGLWNVDGALIGLRDAKVEKGLHVATESQVADWDDIAKRSIETLKDFRTRLKGSTASA